jgi:hypothetical protein
VAASALLPRRTAQVQSPLDEDPSEEPEYAAT